MPTKIEKDIVTGTDTTGHEWDGIKELDTPMPKWWVYTFMVCIAFAAVYCVLYPSWPYGKGYLHGVLGYSSRDLVNREVAAVVAGRAGAMERIAALPYEAIRKDENLFEVAQVSGRITFANNCAPCHAAGGAGRIGYPALAAGAWIWGGTYADIETTLQHGIRSADPDARRGQMPRFGADGILTPPQVEQVSNYVWTEFYGHKDPALAIGDGATLYADNCAACHGPKGEGGREQGAPRLASKVHLYGDQREAVLSQVRIPKAGVMPNWGSRLDPATLKSVVLYVHALGGGE
jgi:cytochrome c oxidase cbb3-type subunit 3